MSQSESRARPSSGASSYAGDLSPKEAWSLLASEPLAVLVDCRSRPEWAFVGVPDLSSLGKTVARVEWQLWPGMTPNASFAVELGRDGVDPDQPVIFLCRSGVRSRSAAIAMTAQGYLRCFNLAGGFEGPHDAARHRGILAGWKAAGLPWTQE